MTFAMGGVPHAGPQHSGISKKWKDVVGLSGLELGTLGFTAKSLQSCPTLCNPIDGSPPGSPVPGILQARTLEWVACWGPE